jgi:hypothetical protein
LTSNDIDRYAVDVRYFEIKTLDVERIDIERSEGDMQHGHFAATPFEVEAERRREILAGDMRRARVDSRGFLSIVRARLAAPLRWSAPRRPAHAGRLNQKRV